MLTQGPLDQPGNVWTNEWDASINPVEATAYSHFQTLDGLYLQMLHEQKNCGGWLCKNVTKLPAGPLPTKVQFDDEILVDDATGLFAQVIEIDDELTGDDGFTYLGDFQWNLDQIAGVLVAQWNNPWKNIGIAVALPPRGQILKLSRIYTYDYPNKTSTLKTLIVNGVQNDLNLVTPAKSMGWAKREIVKQRQQCSKNTGGGYTLRYSGVFNRILA